MLPNLFRNEFTPPDTMLLSARLNDKVGQDEISSPSVIPFKQASYKDITATPHFNVLSVINFRFSMDSQHEKKIDTPFNQRESYNFNKP